MILALGLAMALQAAEAAKPAEPAAPPEPHWVRRPAARDIMGYYPGGAKIRGVPGRAVLECAVTAEGSLTGCQVGEESPSGEGFGDAVLKMAPLFRMRPRTADGKSVAGGKVRIPIRFVVNQTTDPLSAALNCYGKTADVAERDPASTEAWNAAAFFAVQVATLKSRARESPSSFEDSLRAARLGAATAGNDPATLSLKTCLAFATAALKAK